MLPVATGALTAWYLYPSSPSVAPDPPSASDGVDEMWVSEPHRNNTAAATAAHTALVTAMLTRLRAWLHLSLCPHWHWMPRRRRLTIFTPSGGQIVFVLALHGVDRWDLSQQQVVRWTASWERRATQGQRPVPPLPRPTLENDALLALLRHHGWRNSALSHTHQLSHIPALTHSLAHTHTPPVCARSCCLPIGQHAHLHDLAARFALLDLLTKVGLTMTECGGLIATRARCVGAHTHSSARRKHAHSQLTDHCILRNHDHHFQSTQVRGRGGDAGRGGLRTQERPRGSRCAFRAQHTGHISLCCRCCLCVCVRVCR